ncbi:MAG: DUF3540 domain-containing protein [Candidatus Electrothrix sp. AR4]|nr:DUF3540 domain-containing protein [Candidatus Electrothrix sp. AR4]
MALPQQRKEYDNMLFVTGRVRHLLDTFYVIEADQRRIRAVQAVGCLLAPEPGDTVLLAEESGGKAYIVSVLTRTANSAHINLPPDTVVAARGGDLLLCGDKRITFNAPEVQLHADRGVVEINEVDCTADKVDLSISRFRAVWGAVETKAERVVQRISRLYRRINTEDSRLEELHCSVDETYHVEAGEVIIEADERLRLDGDRVELG